VPNLFDTKLAIKEKKTLKFTNMKTTKKINIGKLIKAQFDNSTMSIVNFAKAINKSRNNVYDIFERSSIDTDLLNKIGHVLDYDFFQHYTMPQKKSSPAKARVLIEMELSDAEIIRLGLNEKIFKITKTKNIV